MKKVTLEEIGKELGVSKVAVYKALHNQKGVSDSLREKIKQTATELGYKPSNTKYKTRLNFAYVVKKDFFLSTTEQFYTSIYYYINNECANIESSLEIIFFDEADSFKKLKKSINDTKKSFNGIFVAGELKAEIMEQLHTLSIPIVFIDFYSPFHKYAYVYLDNYNASYLATTHLINKGHKKIGFIGDIHKTKAICDRFLGYAKAMIEKGLDINPEFSIFKNIETENDNENVLPNDLPTAYVCHCDSAGHKLYLLLKLRNVNIPNDISIIGFDNTDICKHLSPQLSSIGVSKEKFASKSMQAMMSLLNKENSKSATFLTPVLSQRESILQLND